MSTEPWKYDEWLHDQVKRWAKERPNEAVKVLLETGALEQLGWLMPHGGMVGLRFPETYQCDTDDWLPVYRLVTEENRG